VFVANYRLLPEHEFWDALDDVLNAYLYLVDERKIPPKSICLYGISSGGGLAVKMIQRLIEENKQNLLPAGAVLMCPFVDYTEPRGSTKEYVKHDLIVNQVCDESCCGKYHSSSILMLFSIKVCLRNRNSLSRNQVGKYRKPNKGVTCSWILSQFPAYLYSSI